LYRYLKDKRVEMKKQSNKKSIHDCIDIDGLTKIEDISCRKIIERDENYKVKKLLINILKWSKTIIPITQLRSFFSLFLI